MFRLLLSSTLCLVAGCTSLGNLDRPALVRSTSTGLCGSTLALEPNNDVWAEGGCENGALLLKPRGIASTAAADELRRQFDALSGVVCVEQTEDERNRRFETVSYIRLNSGEPDVVFERCETVGPEPWSALDVAFDAL